MSQSQSCLQEKLQKKLEGVKWEEPGADWLRDLVEWFYLEMLEMEFSTHLSADPYERTADRQGYRNGYRERQLPTRVSTLPLACLGIERGSPPLDCSSAVNEARRR